MSQGLVVRDAEVPDLAVCAMLQASHAGDGPAETEEQLRAEIARPDRWLLVATVDGVLVGYGRISEHRPPQVGPRDAPAGYYLGGLVIDRSRRRSGYGLALTRARMSRIFAVASEIWYFTNATNTASVRMHSRVGFSEVTRDFTFPGVTFAGGHGILFRATEPAFTASGPTPCAGQAAAGTEDG